MLKTVETFLRHDIIGRNLVLPRCQWIFCLGLTDNIKGSAKTKHVAKATLLVYHFKPFGRGDAVKLWETKGSLN